MPRVPIDTCKTKEFHKLSKKGSDHDPIFESGLNLRVDRGRDSSYTAPATPIEAKTGTLDGLKILTCYHGICIFQPLVLPAL
eukprot:9466464-Pyramimonas_sp.AAC.1